MEKGTAGDGAATLEVGGCGGSTSHLGAGCRSIHVPHSNSVSFCPAVGRERGYCSMYMCVRVGGCVLVTICNSWGINPEDFTCDECVCVCVHVCACMLV
jgi:hypothetical protein